MRKFPGLFLALLCTLAVPAYADELTAPEAETIYITNTDDLEALAENCSYDAWSRNKTVSLENDISLGSLPDFSLRSFGGTFNGNGHRLTDFHTEGNCSPAGIFGDVQPGALVQDLIVEGTVHPSGDALYAGGIAGINRGTLKDCTFYGTVEGEEHTGGIAGRNETSGRIVSCAFQGSVNGKKKTAGIAGSNAGTISFSSSNAYVNTQLLDPGISIRDLDWNMNLLSDVKRLSRMDTYNIASDTGGIAGYNEGSILGCISSGTIGYEHVGYNVGGIAGRNCGLISGAKNNGSILGRKDVGGIAGMAEPYVSSVMTEDKLEELKTEIHTLSDMVDKAAADADSSSASLHSQFADLNTKISNAAAQADTLSAQLKSYADENVSEVNRGGNLLNHSLDKMYDSVDSMLDAATYTAEAGTSFRNAAAALENDTGAADVKAHLDQILQDLDSASSIRQSGMGQIRDGLTQLRNAGVHEYPDSTVQELLDASDELLKSMAAIHNAIAGLETGIDNGSISTLGETVTYLMSSGLPDALLAAPGALDRLEHAVDLLIAGTDVDNAAALEGLSEIKSGISVLRSGRGPGDAGGMFYYLSDALQLMQLHFTGSGLPVSYFREGLRDLDYGNTALIEGLKDLRSMLRYLSREDQLQFRETGGDMQKASESLYGSLQQISDTLQHINDNALSRSGALSADLQSVNEQFRKVTDMAIDNIYDIGDENDRNWIEDTSGLEIDVLTDGKLFLCRNTGNVQGDYNVGGIAGSMTIFDPQDPEADQAGSISGLYHKRYELKSVLLTCTNQGQVTARKNYAGGVCGYARFGLIAGCICDSEVSSETGDYVGGIVGYTDNVIRDSWSKAGLSGEKYIGGIAGASVLPGDESSDALVENCVSVSEILHAVQYAGAISGTDAGTYTGNVFVPDHTGGLNGLSFEGRAEPVSYEELNSGWKGLIMPPELKRFRLQFKADDKVLKSVPFSYGDSFDASVYPEIPSREGYYGVWDRNGLSHLQHDTTVSVKYIREITALSSSATRSAQRPVFFAEGNYDDEAALTAAPSVMAFSLPANGIWQTLRSYNREILEQWHVEIPGRSGRQYFRYLQPTGSGSRCELYMRDANGYWQPVACSMEGSYLRFEGEADGTDLTVLSVRTPWWIWATLGGILGAIFLLILRDIYVRKTEGRANKGQKAKKPLRTRLRRHAIVFLVLILALGSSVAGFIHFAPAVRDGMGLYLLLRNYFERSDLEMDLHLEADLGEENFRTEVSMYTLTEGDKKVSCVNWQGIPVYYCDGMMILENGNAYRLDSELPDYSSILRMALPLYSSVEVSTSELNGVKTYHAAAKDEDAARILQTLVPSLADRLPSTTQVDVDLVTTDADLSSISFSWDGVLKTSEDISATVDAVTYFHKAAGEHKLPQPVASVIKSGSAADIRELGGDLKRLIAAFTEMSARDPVFANAKIQASCGPLVINENLELARTNQYGTDVFRIQRESTGLYAANGILCSENGLSTSVPAGYLSDTWQLFRLAYGAYMKGEPSRTEKDGEHIYEIALDGPSIDSLSGLIVPQAKTLSLHFDSGSAFVSIGDSDSKIHKLVLRASGEADGLLLTAPISLSAELSFHEGEEMPEIPEAVLDVLGIHSGNVQNDVDGTEGE